MKVRELAALPPDLAGSFPALKRAAAAARRLSLATGTPFYVFKDGRVVDLNARRGVRRPGETVSRPRRPRAR
jgi:hypothetical protein